MELNKIINGDCLEGLRSMSDGSVDCVITSPPYWGLRDYGVRGQLGQEKTPEEYVKNLVSVMEECRRVLKDDGTLWLNLGDTYTGSGRGDNPKGKQSTNRGTRFDDFNPHFVPSGLKRKELVGIPWRVAFELQKNGWYLRQDIIWHKPNAMPESVRDRCTKAHEYLFLLSKSDTYHFDHEAIRENAVRGYAGSRFDTGKTAAHQLGRASEIERGEDGKRNRRSVWSVPTTPLRDAHFATFPQELVRPCVLTTRPDAVILDPFMGSGTVAVVAKELGRGYAGFEINPSYVAMAEKRLMQTAMKL